jgi:biotin operon repressor
MSTDSSWFAVFRALFRQGTVAEIGGSAFTVLCCIKSYMDFNNGTSMPSQKQIASETGFSERQVQKSLKVLEAHGLLVREKILKSYRYQLRERIILDDHTVVSWTHIPKTLAKARQELQNFLLTGTTKDAKIINIHVEKLVIENPVAGNQFVINADVKDPELRKQLETIGKHLHEKISGENISGK